MSSSLEAHQLLEKLAARPIVSTSFPTHFNIVLRLKNAMSDPDVSFKKVIDILKGEVVVSAKIVKTANAAVFHGYGEIKDIEKAVMRLGLQAVRRISLGVTMAQLSHSKELLPYTALSRLIWLHSLHTASACYILAREFTKVHPDEAFFTGFVLNLGAFYLLYKASSHPELHSAQDDLKSAITNHYLTLSKKLLIHLEMPESMLEAVDIGGEVNKGVLTQPKTLREIVNAANVLSTLKYSWYDNQPSVELTDEIKALEEEINERANKTLAEFR
jgi:HD-like signal output (HDOD) protein